MSQSRWGSALEACFNTAVGYGLAVAVTWAIGRYTGLTMADDPHWVAAIFTVVSVARNYLMRRAGEWVDKAYRGMHYGGWG